MCCVMNISPIVPISDHLLRSYRPGARSPNWWVTRWLSELPPLPSPQSLIPPLPSLISSSQPFIVKNINKCRENIDKRTVFCMLVLLLSSDVWWEITVRNIIFTQYLCKPNVSPVQQIRSKNKYFVFYWQTQVFDEEKVNHWIWTISCKNICFDPCSNFVVEGK